MHSPFSGASCKLPGAVAAIKRELGANKSEPQLPYPETVNLPFNRISMPEGFLLHPAPQEENYNTEGIWIILKGGNILLQEEGDNFRLPTGTLPDWLLDEVKPLTFASLNGQPVRALSISDDTEPPSGFILEPFNVFQDKLVPDLLSLAGVGKQLLNWQKTSRFCSICNGSLLELPETWGKKCNGCGAEHYPHIHPCAIVVIRRDNQLLMIHKPEWPAGRYSLVAGFLDLGESLEECAIREAMEETGVKIKNVRYVASQAWPFPSQLMVGFVADYASGEVKVDGKEVDDARWFTIGSLPSRLPSQRSIARFLIDSFGSV